MAPQGWEVCKAVGGKRGANRQVVIRLLNVEIGETLGTGTGARVTMTAEQAEMAYNQLDAIGDIVRGRIEQAMEA